MQDNLADLMEEYKKRKASVLEALRSLGIPESMLKGKSLEQLEELLERYG